MIKRTETNRVIFHHSLASYSPVDDIRKWHKSRGFEDVGYHFIIRKRGDVEHGRDITLIGAHADGKNFDSIGICLEGDFRSEEPTEAQYDAAMQMYHCLSRAYGKNLGIEFHRDVDNPCPGIKLDRKKFTSYLLQSGGI